MQACDSLGRGVYVKRQYLSMKTKGKRSALSRELRRRRRQYHGTDLAASHVVTVNATEDDTDGAESEGGVQVLFTLGVKLNKRLSHLLSSAEGYCVLDASAFANPTPFPVSIASNTPAVSGSYLTTDDAVSALTLPSFVLYDGPHEFAVAEVAVFNSEVLAPVDRGQCLQQYLCV
jgi:hypothetical protein